MKIEIYPPPASEAATLVCEGFHLWTPGKESDSWRRNLEDFMLMDIAVSHWGSDCFTSMPMYLDRCRCNSSCYAEAHNDEIDPAGIFIYYEPSLRVMAAASGVKIHWVDGAASIAWRATVISPYPYGVEDGYYSTENLLYQISLASARKLTERSSTTKISDFYLSARPARQGSKMVERVK